MWKRNSTVTVSNFIDRGVVILFDSESHLVLSFFPPDPKS